MKMFKVTYKRGLMAPITVEAKNAAEAIKMGLAEYRRTSGHWELIDNWPAEKVVEKVEEI